MSRPSATTQPWWERSHVCVWVFTCANACVRVCAIERSGSQIQWLINTVLWCTITIMLLASFSYISGAPLTFRMHFLTEVWALFEDASASLPSLLSLASTSVQNYASSTIHASLRETMSASDLQFDGLLCSIFFGVDYVWKMWPSSSFFEHKRNKLMIQKERIQHQYQHNDNSFGYHDFLLQKKWRGKFNAIRCI